LSTWRRVVPIIPARNIQASADFYRDQLGFEARFTESDYGIVERDTVEIHFWGPSRIEPADSDTMLRVEVDDLDVLYRDCQRRELVHPNAPLEDKPWGTREFAIRDLDGHLITFFAHRQ
jgi:catechol 2,3-dioxygenase-like lactoylglutathione lyase family enzyme